MLIAGKILKISPEDVRMPGDPVPEARGWKNVGSYRNTGSVLEIPEGCSFEELEPFTRARVARGIREKLEANGILRTGAAKAAPVYTPPTYSAPAAGDTTQPDPETDGHACDKCDRSFASKRGLRTHQRSSHS
jgi:hypothetical protein